MIKIRVDEGKLPWIVGIGAILAGVLLTAACIFYARPSGENGVAAFLVITMIIVSGFGLCMSGRNRKLIVEDMNICYVNSFGRKKNFTLDEIGLSETI